MSEAAQVVTIDTAQALLAALTGTDLVLRRAALAAVAAEPAAALALGRSGGWDVVDALVHLAYEPTRYSVWREGLEALAAFDDPRTVDVFRKLLRVSDREPTLALAAARLAREPLADTLELGLALLDQERSPRHARAAALLLADADLEPRLAFRRDLLLDRARPEPGQIALLVTELNGPLTHSARRCCEAVGEPLFLVLSDAWDRLQRDPRQWLRRWGQTTPSLAGLAARLPSG